jgi:hypothetical protein
MRDKESQSCWQAGVWAGADPTESNQFESAYQPPGHLLHYENGIQPRLTSNSQIGSNSFDIYTSPPHDTLNAGQGGYCGSYDLIQSTLPSNVIPSQYWGQQQDTLGRSGMCYVQGFHG